MQYKDTATTLRHYLLTIEAEILSAIRYDKRGPYWLVPYYPDDHSSYLFKESSEIFNGDCGIALFFLALYEYEPTPERITLLRSIIDRLLVSEKTVSPQFFCLYSGITGLIYTCTRFFEVTGEHDYCQHALTLTRTHQEAITTNISKFDLLSGHAGNLIAFTLVYHYNRHEDVLAVIHRIIDKYIEQARISAVGLKWDYNKFAYDSMAGFSHGASGIAYALLQTGKYLGYTGLIYLAEEALSYEMQYFDDDSKNWLDLRMGFVRLNLPDAHLWNINTFRPHINHINSWAHGAAGIGLARLFAYQVTGKTVYLDHCRIITERCKNDIIKHREDYTLCSGYAGMIPFLLRYYQLTDDKELIETIHSIPHQAMSLYSQYGSYNTFVDANKVDTGLLSGRSGIGYMLIHLLSQAKYEDVISPRLPQQDTATENDLYSEGYIQSKIFGRYYRRTLDALEDYACPIDKIQSRTIDDYESHLFAHCMQLPAEIRAAVTDIYDLEKHIVKLWKQHKGELSYAKKSEYLQKQAKEVLLRDTKQLAFLKFKISSHVTLIYTSYRQDHPYPLLLIVNEKGITETKPGKLVELMIRHMNAPIFITSLHTMVLSELFPKGIPEKDRLTVQKRITDQLKELLISGLVQACK